MLTIELRMISILCARSPIYFKHVSFWWQFLDLHLTTYHSNIGVQIIFVFNLGVSTLTYLHFKLSEGREICNYIFDRHNLARSSTDKVGVPIRVCELPWTPRIKVSRIRSKCCMVPPKNQK